jgi:hypothetical protein
MAGLMSLFGKKEAPDPKSLAKAVPAGNTIRKRQGYGAYAEARQSQGKPALSLSDWMAGKPDADDDDNELTTRLK